LETLQQLSLVLETPIATFFEDGNPKDQIIHYKAGQRPTVAFSHGILEELGSGTSCRGVVTALVTINPLSNSGEHFIVHTGHEIVFCLEGQLTYTIEDQDFSLEPGDSVFFEAHLPHRWQDRPADRHFAPDISRIGS
jgi:quercetin dioxygenase-like cupin family protein